MKPAQALDIHTALARTLIDDPDERLYRYLSDMARQDTNAEDPGLPLVRAVFAAPTFHVAAEFTPLVEETSASYPETIRAETIIPPSPVGLAVFDEPLIFVDQRGGRQLSHMLLWAEIRLQQPQDTPGCKGDKAWIFTLWNDTTRAADDYSREIIEQIKMLKGARYASGAFGGFFPIQTLVMKDTQQLGANFVPLSEIVRPKPPLPGRTPPPEGVANVGRRLIALWDLMAQPRADVERAEHLESTRPGKSARAAGLTPHVRVITLRRPRPSGAHTGTGRSPEHSSTVVAHRRRYWVGSGEDRHQEWRDIAEHTRRSDLPARPPAPVVYSLRK